MKKQIKSLVDKGYDELFIAKIVGKNRKFIRIFMLENDIKPAIHSEIEYQNMAKELKKHQNDSVYQKEMIEKANISLSKGVVVCNMFDIKPMKKCYCEVCGNEIDTSKSSVPRKYCSKKCCVKSHRSKKAVNNTKKPIIKQCINCGSEFEGSPNSKYCSDRCKILYKDIRGAVECLKRKLE